MIDQSRVILSPKINPEEISIDLSKFPAHHYLKQLQEGSWLIRSSRMNHLIFHVPQGLFISTDDFLDDFNLWIRKECYLNGQKPYQVSRYFFLHHFVSLLPNDAHATREWGPIHLRGYLLNLIAPEIYIPEKFTKWGELGATQQRITPRLLLAPWLLRGGILPESPLRPPSRVSIR